MPPTLHRTCKQRSSLRLTHSPTPSTHLPGQIYARADEGKLNSARVIQRAQDGKLVSGAGTNCRQLDAIIAIDKDALQFERNKLKELQVTRRRAAAPTPPCITGPMVHRGWCSVTCLPLTHGMHCFIQPGPDASFAQPSDPLALALPPSPPLPICTRKGIQRPRSEDADQDRGRGRGGDRKAGQEAPEEKRSIRRGVLWPRWV